MRISTTLIFSVAIFLFAKSSVLAAEDAAKEEGVVLPEMVVTTTRVPTSVEKLPVHAMIITEKEIRETGAKSLADALAQRLPAQFQTYPGALSSVTLRGFRTSATGNDVKGRVLILIDGNRAGTGNLAAIPMENVSRIEVVSGPGSAVYGSAAMGGVINVITNRGKGEPTAEGGGEYGSFGYKKVYAKTSGGLYDDRLGLSFSARTIQREDYDAGGQERIDNTAYNDAAYSLSLYAEPFENHSLSLVASHFYAWDIGSPGPTYSPDRDNTKDLIRWNWSAAYDGALPDQDVRWRLGCYSVWDSSQYNDPAASYGYSSSRTITVTQGTKFHVDLPSFSFGRMLVGVDYDHIKLNAETEPSGYSWSPDSSYDNLGVFAEETVDLGKLTILLGGRYDYFLEKIEGGGSALYSDDGAASRVTTINAGEKSFDNLSWRGGAKYRAFDWLFLRAAVGTGFRAPTADELAGSFESGSMKYFGNPSLKPEKSITCEGGVDVVYKKFTAGATYFYTDYTDHIVGNVPACLNGDCSWTTYKNMDGALISGLEGYLEYEHEFDVDNVNIGLKPYVNWSYYTQREIKDSEYAKELGTNTLPYVAQANVTAGITMKVADYFSMNANAVYSGPQKIQQFNYSSPSYGKAVDKSGFAIFSAKATYRPVKYCEVYVGVDNIADLNYSYVNGYPMPGRSLYGGLKVTF